MKTFDKRISNIAIQNFGHGITGVEIKLNHSHCIALADLVENLKILRDAVKDEDQFGHINATINFINNCIGEVKGVYQASVDLFEPIKKEDHGPETDD